VAVVVVTGAASGCFSTSAGVLRGHWLQSPLSVPSSPLLVCKRYDLSDSLSIHTVFLGQCLGLVDLSPFDRGNVWLTVFSVASSQLHLLALLVEGVSVAIGISVLVLSVLDYTLHTCLGVPVV